MEDKEQNDSIVVTHGIYVLVIINYEYLLDCTVLYFTLPPLEFKWRLGVLCFTVDEMLKWQQRVAQLEGQLAESIRQHNQEVCISLYSTRLDWINCQYILAFTYRLFCLIVIFNLGEPLTVSIEQLVCQIELSNFI